MVTFIEVLNGVNEGSRHQLTDGMTMGRANADIIVKDPKVSSKHAQIALDGKGQLVLLDLDSSNGLYISGRRVKKVALIPGVIFEIGRTQFKVITVEEEQASSFERLLTWRNIVSSTVPQLQIQNSEPPQELQRFSPALKLTFLRGIQADEEIILGYGPRTAGADSLDVELLDVDAPRDAFQLIAGPGQVELKVLATGRVTLNNKKVSAEMLSDGDMISVGNTLIKVSYL
ncbi:FHA domain-containing protein [Bdellovibrio sp. HCB185ZH]|uniref:FHA domain-containing protein n=1 Tax=Bdellovibrio sp. HCB185ZH TaxID=3394235 RepID=UPI0039A6D8D0